MKDLFIDIVNFDIDKANVAILDSNELRYIDDCYKANKLLNAIIDGNPDYRYIDRYLRKDSPEIQEFDRICICRKDGRIKAFIKGKDY